MSHFAEIDENNVVLRVIVAEQDYIDTLPGRWIQTSYNNNLRKNFAGVGYTYDEARDAFLGPQPYPSWVLNETTCRWDPPVPRPASPEWDWDEASLAWVK